MLLICIVWYGCTFFARSMYMNSFGAATLYRYKLCHAQLLSLISQSMFFCIASGNLYSATSLNTKKKRTKCVRGIGVKKARESYECWRRFVAWDVSALICRCSHRDNYSHWLEFSVQFFMLVLLITIFSGHEFMNSFCLFIHFHPDIQMNVKTRFFLLANELFSEIVRRAQMDWIFRKAFQLKWKWHFISMNDDDDDDDNLFDFMDRKTQMMWFLYTQHKQEI